MLGLLLRRERGPYHLNALASFTTQEMHKDGSRPYMVGYDLGARKRVLFGSKCWATLPPHAARQSYQSSAIDSA